MVTIYTTDTHKKGMVGNKLHKGRLFNAVSVALVVTAMTFAVRANLLGPLGKELELSKKVKKLIIKP